MCYKRWFVYVYALHQQLQPDQFMKNWLILAPVPVAATGLQGFSSVLTRLPKKNFTVALLANSLPHGAGDGPREN